MLYFSKMTNLKSFSYLSQQSNAFSKSVCQSSVLRYPYSHIIQIIEISVRADSKQKREALEEAYENVIPNSGNEGF